MGADKTIDYTKEDFTQNGETYDVIFDTAGKIPYSRSIRSLTKNGRYLLANPVVSKMIRGVWVSLTSSKKVIFQFASPTPDDLMFLKELVEAGKVWAAVDRCFPLDKMVEAHSYVDEGHKQGNVSITVEHDRGT